MLRLTLVRHAKSSWDDPGLADFDRPLNARGLRDAPAMAARVAALPKPPAQLVSSPALRAISTAQVFAAALGLPPERIERQPRIYEASRATLVEVVRGLDPGARHVMLFGHNPGFSELANWLATCPFDQMPTCAVAGFELGVGSWREVDGGCARLQRYLYPKDGG